MAYFTWKESGLTSDCVSLDAMASRLEESARLMRRMAADGFQVVRHPDGPHITHSDPAVFESFGFINEEEANNQLTLLS